MDVLLPAGVTDGGPSLRSGYEMVCNKYLANITTGSRIAGAFVLLATVPFSTSFFLIYTYCGFTDVIDGKIVRKLNTDGRIGAMLDSIADMLLFIAVSINIIPPIAKDLSIWSVHAIVWIALIRVTAYIVGKIKFRRYTSLHTILNKMTGAALFAAPYLMVIIKTELICLILCIVAGLSSVEELLCEMRMKEYNPNVKSMIKL